MGYVTSADTGSEDLVLASRSALATYCLSDADGKNSEVVFTALSGIIKGNEGEDRIVVPAMDVLVFLGDVGAWDGIELKEYVPAFTSPETLESVNLPVDLQ